MPKIVGGWIATTLSSKTPLVTRGGTSTCKIKGSKGRSLTNNKRIVQGPRRERNKWITRTKWYKKCHTTSSPKDWLFAPLGSGLRLDYKEKERPLISKKEEGKRGTTKQQTRKTNEDMSGGKKKRRRNEALPISLSLYRFFSSLLFTTVSPKGP